MIYAMLKQYEQTQGANDSTYWIYFELLWREYFYWYARCYQQRLFRFGGIRNQTPLTSFMRIVFSSGKQHHTVSHRQRVYAPTESHWLYV